MIIQYLFYKFLYLIFKNDYYKYLYKNFFKNTNNKLILDYGKVVKVINHSYKSHGLTLLFKGKNSVVRICMPLKVDLNMDINGDNANIFLDKEINGDLSVEIKGNNNILNIKKNINTSDIDNKIINTSIHVDGYSNNVSLHPSISKTKINVFANNSNININNNVSLLNSNINISGLNETVENNSINIGKYSSFEGVNIQTYEDNSKINIGDDCQLSWGIDIWCSDSHAILNSKKEVINYGYNIEIGNHVWIGKDVKIGKNSKISDNSIVGWGSVITHKFDQKNIIIAGVPAKIMKTDISWDRRRVNKFILEN